jgi:hypothetical protein
MAFSPSTTIPDADFLLARASAEADAAEYADHPLSADAHHRLASLYLDRVFGDGAAPRPSMAPPARGQAESKRIVSAALQQLKPAADISDFTDLLVRLP